MKRQHRLSPVLFVVCLMLPLSALGASETKFVEPGAALYLEIPNQPEALALVDELAAEHDFERSSRVNRFRALNTIAVKIAPRTGTGETLLEKLNSDPRVISAAPVTNFTVSGVKSGVALGA